MKTAAAFGFVLIAASTLLGGCLDETAPVDGDDVAAAFGASIDGTTWTAAAPSATRVVPPNAITIVGTSTTTGEYISINLRASSTGAYSFSGNQHLAICKKGGKEFTTAAGGSGTIEVTKYDEEKKLISATFTFVAKNSAGEKVTIAEGKVTNIKWREQ